MDYSRQLEVFNPSTFKHPVHVIGCGATGSWVAVMLAKLGVQNLHLHDFDTVEEHNLPNQLYTPQDIGGLKVRALKALITTMTGHAPEYHDRPVTGDTPLSGIVFILTDTMQSRKEIYREALRNNINVPLVIETRMCAEGGRVYVFNPCLRSDQKAYNETLNYTDEDAPVSACGVMQSLAPTAAMLGGLAVWQLIKFHNGDIIDNEIIFDARGNTFLTRSF